MPRMEGCLVSDYRGPLPRLMDLFPNLQGAGSFEKDSLDPIVHDRQNGTACIFPIAQGHHLCVVGACLELIEV